MRRSRELDWDDSQPSLVVTYGNTTRKHRPLDRSLIVLGRGRGCDLALASPEIAPIHCLIARGSNGWSIRDCGSRAGTHVNGVPIEETPLRDGDVVQVGPFCFRAHLPAHSVPLCDDRAILRLRRSRRNLAMLGLALRRRLSERRWVQGQQQEQLAQCLQERLRACEQREAHLVEAERELAVDRDTLDQEYQNLQERLAQAEQELARRQAEVEAEMRARWSRLQKLCQESEQAQTRALQRATPLADQLSQEAHRLELRSQELEHFARHLRRRSGWKT